MAERARIVATGAVDDGKSTLLGRLIHDLGLVPEDQLAAARAESPPEAGGLDFSLFFDGLEAEREQAITIDVAHRYFEAGGRSFALVDAPGHQQYTRNLVTGATQADAALLVIDAGRGLREATRRHLAILDWLRMPHVAVAINKMDLVGYDRAAYDALAAQVREAARTLRLGPLTILPVSGVSGANVVHPATELAWHDGPTLWAWMRGLPDRFPRGADDPFLMPVQRVVRARDGTRCYAGVIVAGALAPGDEVAIAGTRLGAKVRALPALGGGLDRAEAGDAVTVELDTEHDVGRGAVLHAPGRPPHVGHRFVATLFCAGDRPLVPMRDYLLQLGAARVGARIRTIRPVEAGDPTDRLEPPDLARCDIALAADIAFLPYAESRELGSFILVDKDHGGTVGAGTVERAAFGEADVIPTRFDVTPAHRAAQKKQRPVIAFLTGLSGAGKSTVANHVDALLHARGLHTAVLDGDNIRGGLCADLGFNEAARVENIRRVAEVARLMAEAGLVVLVPLIAPYRRERAMARERAGEIPFLEIFVDAPLQVCERRDPKGLYARARAGEIAQFTGVDSPYERPERPDLHLRTDLQSTEECAGAVLGLILRYQ
jgi:bifunctional enzyme CysN/CysC